VDAWEEAEEAGISLVDFLSTVELPQDEEESGLHTIELQGLLQGGAPSAAVHVEPSAATVAAKPVQGLARRDGKLRAVQIIATAAAACLIAWAAIHYGRHSSRRAEAIRAEGTPVSVHAAPATQNVVAPPAPAAGATSAAPTGEGLPGGSRPGQPTIAAPPHTKTTPPRPTPAQKERRSAKAQRHADKWDRDSLLPP
jgi:hypothetical protein